MKNTKDEDDNKAVTKREFKAGMSKFEIELYIMREDIKVIREEMYTKKDHEKFMVYMDEAMKELRDAREERILHGKQFLRMDDQVNNHEKRIRVLEKKN